MSATSEPVEHRLLDAACRQLRDHGAERVTVSSIAASLGMSHANVYRHFSSKIDLFDAVTASWLKCLEARLRETVAAPDPAADKLYRLLIGINRTYRSKAIEDPHLYALFLDALAKGRAVTRKHRSMAQSAIQRTIEEGQASGNFLARDARKAVPFVFDACHRFIHPAAVALDRDVDGGALELRRDRVLRIAILALVRDRL